MIIRCFLWALFIIGSVVKVEGQSLTYGEVYDYKVGDEFAIKSQVTGNAPFFNKMKIISKVNYGQDTIVYQIKNTLYKLNFYDRYWYKKEVVFEQTITNLKLPVFSAFPAKDSVAIDTSFNNFEWYHSHDSSYYSVCNIKVNSRKKVWDSPVSDMIIYDTTAYKGVGIFVSYYKNGFDNVTVELQYTIKDNVFCGDSSEIAGYAYKASVNTGLKKTIHVYPNPAIDLLNVQHIGNFSYTIYDIQGEKIQEGQQTEDIIPIKTLNNGLYFIQIQGDSGIYNAKFIKE